MNDDIFVLVCVLFGGGHLNENVKQKVFLPCKRYFDKNFKEAEVCAGLWTKLKVNVLYLVSDVVRNAIWVESPRRKQEALASLKPGRTS